MERYCPSKKPANEHDKECYYHGPLEVCPLCGTPTWQCKVGVIEEKYTDYSILGDVQHRGQTMPQEPVYNYSRIIPGDEIEKMKIKGKGAMPK